MLDRQLAFVWTTAQLVYDDPAMTLDTTARTDVLLFPELVRTIGRPQKTLDFVSPYFVPGDEGTTALDALSRRGVKVRILTNSLAALHAKSFAVDRSRIFVGSFNFDQRSALLNTEMGLVIDSPALAQPLAGFFDAGVPMIAYEVLLAPDSRNLEWIEKTSCGDRRYGTDPGTTSFLRSEVDILSILPIEWLL